MVGPFIVSWGFASLAQNDVLTINRTALTPYRIALASSNPLRRTVDVQIRNVDHVTFRNSPSKAIIDYLALENFQTSGEAPIDCQQTSLAVSSPCSTKCGVGTICFGRTTLIEPANGGRPCEPSTVCTACNDATGCVVDCVISAFGPASQCSVTCGTGTQIQTATVVTPPQNGGAACPSLVKTSFCFMPACPANQNCVWGNWSAWSTCTLPCGSGSQTRTRTIQAPQTGTGTACTGSSTETQVCNTQSCSGTSQTIVVKSVSGSSGGFFFHAWPTAPVNIAGQTVKILMSGFATDPSTSVQSNGFYQFSAATSCTFSSVPTVQCPRGVPFTSLNGNLGSARCTSSSSTTLITDTANVTFVVRC